MKNADSSVSLVCLRPFLRAGASFSALRAALRQEGIELGDFASPSRRVSQLVCARLLGNELMRTHDPLLGLEAGTCWEPGDFDVFDQVVCHSRDVGHALQNVSRLLAMLCEGVADATTYDGEHVRWELRTVSSLRGKWSAASEFALACTAKILRTYASTPVAPVRVYSSGPAPLSRDEYRRAFYGAPVSFAARYPALIYSAESLAVPMAKAHEGLCATFLARALELVEAGQVECGENDAARRILTRQLDARRECTQSTVAAAMGISTATLRRRLIRRGTTFVRLKAELREELAIRYLGESSLSVAEVAFKLGFSQASALSKAFRKWKGGLTPSEYRSSLRTQAAARP